MRWLNNQVRFGLAAVVACGGAAYGAHLYQDQPQVDRAQTQQIRQLAERIQTQTLAPAVVLSPTSLAPVRPIGVSETEKPKVTVQPAAAAAKPVETKLQTPVPAAPVAPAVPVDPVKNIALMGVTHQGEAGRAWLVDLESHTREVVGEGEEAFGFTIKEIDDESVLLARGSETYNLRLGEKEIPTVASAAPESSETSGVPGGAPGGGDDRGDRRARFAAMMSQMANGGGRSWGGRSWGGGSGGWSGNSGNWGGRSNWGNNGGSRWASNQSGRGFGGFSGGGFGGGNFGGGNFGGRNNQNASMNRPTSNPQEARRRKSRLVGGANAIAEPDAFNNPQTQRRLGTTSGQAFGTGNNNQSRR